MRLASWSESRSIHRSLSCSSARALEPVVRKTPQSWQLCVPAVIVTEPVLVIDTSAALDALASRGPAPGLIERLAGDGDLHTPHLIDTEVLHALRRMIINKEISDDRAADVRSDFADLKLVRYPHEPLSDRIWALRHNLTAYDATFVALAEMLAAPLVTCDARLASAPGHTARIELFTAEAQSRNTLARPDNVWNR